MRKARNHSWTEEESKKLFKLYKEMGSRWSILATYFPSRNENQIKNRFYSTLRRVAKKSHNASRQKSKIGKDYLVQFVDDAILYGHNCRSKRGRKPKNPKKINDNIQNENNFHHNPFLEVINPNAIEDNKEEVKNLLRIQESINAGQIENIDMKSVINDENREGYEDVQICELDNPKIFPGLLVVDPNYIRSLIQLNEEALKILDEKTVQSINDPQELFELLKDMKNKLKETQTTIRAICTRYSIG